MLSLLGNTVHSKEGWLSVLTGIGGTMCSRKHGATFPGQADLRKLTSGGKLLYHSWESQSLYKCLDVDRNSNV